MPDSLNIPPSASCARPVPRVITVSAPAKTSDSDTPTASAKATRTEKPSISAKASNLGKSSTAVQDIDDGQSSPLTAVAPAAPVELTWSTVERTVTRLIMQNAAQQATINQLSATVAVLLEESKDYEKITSDAAGHNVRIEQLERSLQLAREESKALREEAKSWDKAVNSRVDDHGRQLEGLAGVLNVVNNWTAYQMKRELGESSSSSNSVAAAPTPAGSTSSVATMHNPSTHLPNNPSTGHQPPTQMSMPSPDELAAILDMFERQGGTPAGDYTGQASASVHGVATPAGNTPHAGTDTLPQGGLPCGVSDSIEEDLGFRYEYDEVEDLLLYIDSDSDH